ncbi:MAG TPA: carboxypeptidase-like regulatory domain-containing protein [Polyangia bacterium]|nr:carboxypeptidase-like regulatory domain-containing protein [Polyangia bacterium]
MTTSPDCRRTILRLALAAAVCGASAPACRRSHEHAPAANASVAQSDPRDVRCVERPEGCIWCVGKGPAAPLVESSDALPPSLCDPKDPGNCVDFCSRLAPDCALPWRSGPSCLLASEPDFRRELFRRDTADRPEAVLQGKVTDDAGKRVEGAKIRVWFQGTAILDDVSGKDGSYRLRLRAGPGSYFLRIGHPGLATEISDFKPNERAVTVNRSFRLGPESTARGKVTDGKGSPIGGVIIHALRNPDEPIESGEAQTADDGTFVLGGLDTRRYFLRASKLGWLPTTVKWTATQPATRVAIKMLRTTVIKGVVLDADGEGRSNATVVALQSSGGSNAGPGGSSPIIWTVDSAGEFAQDRFPLGVYYLWARHGEMLAYPPEKIELDDQNLDAEIELKLSHRGARVRGKVTTVAGTAPEGDARAVLVGRSPLALPRKALGEIDREGAFVVSGLLPGRYELSIRIGPRTLPITRGPREVEVPIEAGTTVDLPEPIVVRAQSEE